MKILLLDIETAPNTAHVWDLWNQNVSLSQLRESSYTLCYGFKWYGESKFYFERVGQDDDEGLNLGPIWNALDEADIVSHWNGKTFDIPILNKDFLLYEMEPPAPYKQIDLCSVAKKVFRFPSNKLDYVSQALGIGGKVQHSGHDLWVRCMAGDEKAWKEMEKYNRQDVFLLEPIFDRLHPWIPGLPNQLLFDGNECPRCGVGGGLSRQGYTTLTTGKYQRYKCYHCGGWSRDTKRCEGVTVVGIDAV